MARLSFLALLLCAFIECSEIPAPPQMPSATHVSMGVPVIGQRATNWCWAAATQMVMQYIHDNVDDSALVLDQCELAKYRYIWLQRNGTPPPSNLDSTLADTMNLDCSSGEIPSEFNLTNLPFTPTVLYDTAYQQDSTISWDSLQSAIAHKHPVIFEWIAEQIGSRSTTCGHVMVAEGCFVTPGHRWVSINDPWLLDTNLRVGRHEQIEYSEFVQSSRVVTPWDKNFVFAHHGTDWVVCRTKVLEKK